MKFLILLLSMLIIPAQASREDQLAVSCMAEYKLSMLREGSESGNGDTNAIVKRYNDGVTQGIARKGYWDSLIKDANRTGCYLVEGKASRFYGNLLATRGGGGDPLFYLNSSLEVARRTGNKNEEIDALKYVAAFYRYIKSDNRKALDLCYKALDLSKELKDTMSIVNSTSALADLYWQTGDIKRSLELHRQCLKYCEARGDADAITRSLLDVGIDYCSLKDTLNTVRYYLKTLNYITKLKNPLLITDVYNSVAAAYSMRWMNDSAYYYSTAAYKIIKQGGNKHYMAGILSTLADICLKRGDVKSALKYTNESMALSTAIDYKLQIPALALLYKRIHLHNKNYKGALEAYELYVSSRDSISNEKNRKEMLEKEFKYNLDKKESENKLLAQQNQIQSLSIKQDKYLLLGLLGLLALLAIIAYLLLRQNKFKAAQQRMQLEQKLISSQMNPHFIFNSLNSIQQLIMSGENQKAETYLSKFAKMIRELLETSEKESVTIGEEIDLLNAYLEMESRRFGKSFSYTVTADEKTNLTTGIPRMMVQPFVENAIWHGLLAKNGDRSLTVVFSKREKTVCCRVEDNGIGREASMKRESTFKRKSLALSFVKQRLELMRETLKINCYVEITDKRNENGEGAGTLVELILPII